MRKIVKLLPKKRQTMLFSATSTKKTEDLVAVALKKEPIYIGIEEKTKVGISVLGVLCLAIFQIFHSFFSRKVPKNYKFLIEKSLSWSRTRLF